MTMRRSEHTSGKICSASPSPKRQHAGEDLEAEVLFVAQPVRAALEHADLVVQTLDEAEGDLVLREAVGRDPLSVPINHGGEFLVGPQALPLEGRPPVLEEAARPALAAVVPELAEGFLEQVGGVQPLVGGEQRRELEMTDFDLPAALDNALTLVRERARRRGMALHMTVDDRLGEVRADERKIRQVVLNLLSNAIKFTPEGGRIEVRALPIDEVVEVSVSDTGGWHRPGGSGGSVRLSAGADADVTMKSEWKRRR